MEATDLVLAVLRVWLGGVMIAHGLNHLRKLAGTAQWFRSLGWKCPRYQAAWSGIGEVGAGVCLVLGLATPLAAGGLVAIMFVAYISHHRRNGFFIFNPGEGYEYVVTIAVAAIAVAGLGPGEWSVDFTLGVKITGWEGLAFALGGLIAGAAHVLAFWRPSTGAENP